MQTSSLVVVLSVCSMAVVGANFDCQWAARIEKDRWTAEMRLPLDQFGYGATPGGMLHINLARNVQGAKPEISTWLSSLGAHADPMNRGILVFE
ncbi:MAG: hypothetical protein A3K19_15245 [Lentisphaerae bacterium RIFOXYB12_FULL_65_16]|nr:MAG: hypothetical protein A3K18_06945 [Lentisphaerae bacterium RIFOXYA12_64_32]OGV88447.1 MAG: hypothetical protein A3K19_15245 [Lentisphaerae bacterium RIFOXYB12_FULL_65_16]